MNYIQLADWSFIKITGLDRKSFLHSFCTNNINQLSPGTGCEAFVTTIQGKILAHILVFATEDELQLIGVPGTAEAVVPHLQKYLLGLEAEIVDCSAEQTILCCWGEGLETVFGSLPENTYGHINLPDLNVNVARVSLTRDKSCLVVGSKDSVAQTIASLSDAKVASKDTFEFERIAAGFPYHGIDISDANIAQEAARGEQAISFEKGCYLGQEPIARLDAMGHTNKELRGLSVTQETTDLRGSILTDGDKEVGRVTSFATQNGNTVALAMVRAISAKPGHTVQIKQNGATLEATVFWPTLG